MGEGWAKALFGRGGHDKRSYSRSELQMANLEDTQQLRDSDVDFMFDGEAQPLLTFKAGKMEVVDKGGDKFHISPDLRKGSISLFKGPDDQLMHFAWKERPSGSVVDDIIILPEEAVYKKVDTGREGERVFLMEIAGNRRFFYWMQDKDADKDEENMKKVNELTNSPPSDDAPTARGSSNSDMMELLSSMGGGAGTSGLGAAGGAGSGGGASNEQGLNIQNLQSILQNMGFSPQEQAFAAGGVTPATPSSGTISAAAAAAATPATDTTTATAPAEAVAAAADPEPAGASATPAAAAASTPTAGAVGNSGVEGSDGTTPSGAAGEAAEPQAGGDQSESERGANGEGEGGDGKEEPADRLKPNLGTMTAAAEVGSPVPRRTVPCRPVLFRE
eukprot:jgi/Undpi1/8243/HiC_scaffold_25.g10713.m1